MKGNFSDPPGPKYRVLEVKRKGKQSKFYPQYKGFIFWKYITGFYNIKGEWVDIEGKFYRDNKELALEGCKQYKEMIESDPHYRKLYYIY